jgi:nucleoside-diphosphate-sugar epimerase
MKVFLTGASGFVGLSLIDDLINREFRIHALVRDQASADQVHQKGALPVHGDLTDPDTYQHIMKDIDAIIHLAAFVGFSGNLKRFSPVNVTGTKALVEAAVASGIKTIVYVSAAAVALNGSPLIYIDESFKPKNMISNGYLESKVLAERELLNHGDKIRVYILRPPIIWGPGMRIMEQFRSTIEKMGFPLIGKPDHKLPTCHVKNLTAAILLGLEHPQARGVYLIKDKEETAAKPFLDQLIKSYGMNMGNLRLSRKFALIMASSLETIWKLLKLRGDPPMTKFIVHLMGTEFTIDDSKIRQTLGYKSVLSIQEGLRQLQKGSR